MSDLPTVTVRQWTDVVRRARLGRTVKGIALAIATYADFETGRRVRPGIARLAVDAEVTYNVAQNALASLRDAGLLELVHKATTRGASDEYRLVLADDVLDRIEVLTPARVTAETERMRAVRRGKYRQRQGAPDPEPPDLHPTGCGAGDVENPDLHPTAQGAEAQSAEDLHPTACTQNPDLHPTATYTCTPRRDPPPPTRPTTTTTPHPDHDVRTAVTGPRATRPPDQDPISRGGIPLPREAAPPFVAALAVDDPRPTRRPCPTGIGVCIICAEHGDFVIATNPATGSRCATHTREAALA